MTPIIIIHQGDSHYLAYTIAQARHVQSGIKPILLGDEGNRHYRGADFFPYREYFREAANFSTIYRHYNPSPHHHAWLLFCFQKWIFLHSFLQREGIEKCLLIDSDVLVYVDPSRLSEIYKDAALTVSEGDPAELAASGHTSLIHSVEMLGELGSMMHEMFLDTPLHDRIKSFAEVGRISEPQRGITEMSALSLLRERFPSRVINTYGAKVGPVIDHSLLSPQGYRMDQDHKRLQWTDSIPYGLRSNEGGDDTWQPFASLHFQGHARRKMMRVPSNIDSSLKLERGLNRIRYRIQKETLRFTRLASRLNLS